MKLNIRKFTMDVLPGSIVPRVNLDRATSEVLRRHLGSLRVKGLKDLDIYMVQPVPKKAPAPAVYDVKYAAAKQKVTCRFVLSPAVSVEDSRWRDYRPSYVQQVKDLTIALLSQVEVRLNKEGHAVDLSAVRGLISRDLESLATAQRDEESKPEKPANPDSVGKKPAAKKPAAKKV